MVAQTEHNPRARLAARVAGIAGRAVGVFGRSFPGIVGPLFVVYGLAQIWRPLAWVAGGILIWSLDRRV